MVKHAVEANFDGLVGPTHNYAGLSWGNVASKSNVNAVANPREAALQGLEQLLEDHGLGHLDDEERRADHRRRASPTAIRRRRAPRWSPTTSTKPACRTR